MKQHNQFINNYEKSISLMVLSCINDLEMKVGTKKLVGILQGSESDYIFKNEYYNNPFYGLLQNYNSKQITKIIERMIDMGLVEIQDLELEYYSSVFDLTSKGKLAVGSSELDTPNLSNILVDSKLTNYSDQSNALFEKFRKLRKEIAKSIKKPAYIVCHDKVLRQVALEQPKDEDGLLAIKGIGEHFIQNYSSLFLNEIELNEPNCQITHQNNQQD